MSETERVAVPPPRPLLVFDGDCGFCRLWIERWRQATGGRVDYVAYQSPDVAAQFPEIPRSQFARAVHLIEPDGTVYQGAHAVLRTRAKNPHHQWLLRFYQGNRAFAFFAETIYRLVARNRPCFSLLTRIGWGKQIARPEYVWVRAIFLRGLGLIYLIAFLSLWSQIVGLVGRNGILPAESFMADAGTYFASHGIGLDRYRILPTLCWFDASDASLRWQCAAGAALAVLFIIGIAPAPCLFLLWAIYLSLSSASREFLSFQWDILLLETGFLAIFLTPLRLWPFGRRTAAPPSRAVVWLLRWLLFQLMFESGIVKLTSGDAAWRNLTALTFHYETQPLPTWIGWYAHQLPLWFQKTSCFVMFVIELAAPFLFFGPRRLRNFAAAATAGLQVLILLTGNYTFFNWLALLLCLALLDDSTLSRFFPVRFCRPQPQVAGTPKRPELQPWPRWVIAPLVCGVMVLTLGLFLATLGARWPLLKPVFAVEQFLAPFRTFNSYGLFRVMTTTRPEIVVEGSRDGVNWLPYEFNWKPGDLMRRPRFVAPHQPRLDWQMWFAALGELRQNPWFGNFAVRLLEGSPEVLDLLAKNPFPEGPPRYVRAMLCEYHFTAYAERRATGAWWKRTERGTYLQPVSLEQVERH